MSPRERAEYNYKHMKVGDLVRHWDGNIGIVLEIDPVEAKIKWIKDPKGETLWQMLYNLETLCDMSTLVG
jgi:hypothetical protein